MVTLLRPQQKPNNSHLSKKGQTSCHLLEKTKFICIYSEKRKLFDWPSRALILVSYLIQDGAKKAGWAHAKGPGRIGGRSKLCKERKFISCYFWLQLNHKLVPSSTRIHQREMSLGGVSFCKISSIRNLDIRHPKFRVILSKVKSKV